MRHAGNPLVNALDLSHFYVIAVVSNPIRYQSRIALFDEFKQHIKDLGGNLIIVETAYGQRPFVVTTPNNFFINQNYDPKPLPTLANHLPVSNPNLLTPALPMKSMISEGQVVTGARWANARDNDRNLREYHIQFRTEYELWHKENMINLSFGYLNHIDPNWEKAAWIDADIHFQRPDALLETAQQLEHYDWVQMFSHAIDLGPDSEPIRQQNGFMWSYFKNNHEHPQGHGYGGYAGGYSTRGEFWHPGYAWAARRRALEKVTLFDKAILGSADHHMAMGLIGCQEKCVHGDTTQAYKDCVLSWQIQAESRLKRNVGYVPGLITHYWHGSKENRKYNSRWKIMIDNDFNPYTDISRDTQGLYKLENHHGMRSIKLRDDIRTYFRARNEDSIDIGE